MFDGGRAAADTALPGLTGDQSSILAGTQTGRQLPGQTVTFRFILMEAASPAAAGKIAADLQYALPAARTVDAAPSVDAFVNTTDGSPWTVSIQTDGPLVSVVTVDSQDAAAAETSKAGVAAQTAVLHDFTPNTAAQIGPLPADFEGM